MPMNNECTFTVVDIHPAKPTKQMLAAMKRANPVAETRTASDKPNHVYIDGRYTDNPRLARGDAFTGIDGLGSLSIVAGQNKLFELNREWRLTDAQMCATWNALWNNRGGYPVSYIGGARGEYNRGTHGNRKPSEPIRQYRVGGPDDDGYLGPPKSKTVGVIA